MKTHTIPDFWIRILWFVSTLANSFKANEDTRGRVYAISAQRNSYIFFSLISDELVDDVLKELLTSAAVLDWVRTTLGAEAPPLSVGGARSNHPAWFPTWEMLDFAMRVDWRQAGIIALLGFLAGALYRYGFDPPREANLANYFRSGLHGVGLALVGWGIHLFLLNWPRLVRLPFLAELATKSIAMTIGLAVAAATLQFALYGGIPDQTWLSAGLPRIVAYAFVASLILGSLLNLLRLIGPRVLVNFVLGRYHRPYAKSASLCFSTLSVRRGSPRNWAKFAFMTLLLASSSTLTVPLLRTGERSMPMLVTLQSSRGPQNEGCATHAAWLVSSPSRKRSRNQLRSTNVSLVLSPNFPQRCML